MLIHHITINDEPALDGAQVFECLAIEIILRWSHWEDVKKPLRCFQPILDPVQQRQNLWMWSA